MKMQTDFTGPLGVCDSAPLLKCWGMWTGGWSSDCALDGTALGEACLISVQKFLVEHRCPGYEPHTGLLQPRDPSGCPASISLELHLFPRLRLPTSPTVNGKQNASMLQRAGKFRSLHGFLISQLGTSSGTQESLD